jgi:hypothetical protein
MNLAKYWEVLTRDEKEMLLQDIKYWGQNRHNLHLGMLPFISREEATRCYALCHTSSFLASKESILLKKIGVVDVSYHMNSDSIWLTFDGPLEVVEVVPFRAYHEEMAT